MLSPPPYQVGGLLGLCLGISLASGVELVYWLGFRLWFGCKKADVRQHPLGVRPSEWNEKPYKCSPKGGGTFLLTIGEQICLWCVLKTCPNITWDMYINTMFQCYVILSYFVNICSCTTVDGNNSCPNSSHILLLIQNYGIKLTSSWAELPPPPFCPI